MAPTRTRAAVAATMCALASGFTVLPPQVGGQRGAGSGARRLLSAGRLARPRLSSTSALLGPAAAPPGLVLTEQERGKDNLAPDEYYYDYPRICYHADAAWHAQLTALYEEHLPYGDDVKVLDMMTSWVSHYPTDGRTWGRVTGLGMNAEELAKNQQLDFYETQDLNQNRRLPFEANSFAGVTIAFSIQYLQQPEEVVYEIARVLQPGGKCIVAFSNRMFPSKAIYGWRYRTEGQRLQLVANYFSTCGAFKQVQRIDKTTPLHAVSKVSQALLDRALTDDSFYAVIATKAA